MELLLNLLWLMLAVPGVWLWHRQAHSAEGLKHGKRFSCVLLLGCILILLFPVISASDDMHAMRSEAEESSPCNKLAKQLQVKATQFHSAGDGNVLALFSNFLIHADFTHEMVALVSATHSSLPGHVQSANGRAPPTLS